MKQYDVIIIGFGKGGKTLAAELAKRKLDVAVVERSEKMYGGTCINIGCIPTKTLVHAAKHADKDASWEVKKAYYRQSIARKEEVVSFLRQKNYHNLADNPHITVYTGIGSFAGPDVVEVGMVEGTLQLQAPRIFINTGAETVIPPIEGIQGVREVLEQKGIVFRLNARVQSVKDSDVIYRDAVTGEEHQLHADAILLATGRRPNTAGLNLAAAGVEVNERGAIVVDDYLQTTNPKIHAIGDVKGGLQFTYISLDDYRILREDLFGAGERKVSDRDPVSYSVFIDPPLSRIGLSEAEARKKGLNIKVNKLPVAAVPRARTLGDTNGLFKVVVDADTDKIVGCTLFGPESSEVINLVAMAMKTGQEYTFLRDFVFTHPSMSEALNDLMGF